MRFVSNHELSIVQMLPRERKETHRILRVFRVAGYSGYLRLRSRCNFSFHGNNSHVPLSR